MVLGKLGRLPFKIIDKWTPTFIQNKIGVLVDELGQYVQTGGSYLSSTSKIPSYFPNTDVHTLEEVNKLPVSKMDGAAKKLTANRKKLATLQGASTGNRRNFHINYRYSRSF